MRVELTASEIRAAVKAALAEDLGGGDVTTLATVPRALTFKAVMRAREPLVVAGLDFARAAFLRLSSAVKVEYRVHDGTHVGRGENLLRICGSARAILTAERVALNFVQRLSGIATLTAQFVAAIPLGRWGKVEDIGHLAVYLCSEEAGFITGTDIVIDGGWTAR